MNNNTLSYTYTSTSKKLKWNFFDITIYLHFFLPSIVLFKEPFEFYITYVFIIAYLPFLLMKYNLPRFVWWILLILLITGILNIWLDNNTYKNFFKIYINLSVNILFYGLVMAYYNYDVEEMFRRYLKGALIVSIIGVVQLIGYKMGISYLYDLRIYNFNKWGTTPGGLGIRVNATYPEPAFFAEFISPAAFLAMYNIFFLKEYLIKKWESWIILSAFLLSYSSLAYAGIFTALIIFLLNYGLIRYLIFFLPTGIFIFYMVYSNVEEFRDRVDGIKTLFIDEYLIEEKNKEIMSAQAFVSRQYRVLTKVHGSPLVLYNNYYVAIQNFKQNSLFGSGLGSHEIAFEKYNLNYLISKWYVLNTPDANSMALRIISELGLLGIIFTIMFIRNNFVLKIRDTNIDNTSYWLISGALLVIIVIQLLRQGNYTYSGFIFFVWLYYQNKVNYQQYLLSLQQNDKNESAIS